MSSHPQVSTAFASREFNGEVMLDELAELRDGQVQQQHLNDCAVAAREFTSLRATEAAQRLKHLASARFQSQPALASLLVRWANRLKTEPDVAQFASHLQRLAVTSALVSSVRRSGRRG